GRCQHRLTPFPPSYATEKPCIAVDESSFLHGVPPASPCSHRWRFPSQHTGKSAQVRTPSAKTKSAPLDRVITETLKLWRKYHLPYDKPGYVAKEARRALALARPLTGQRVIARLSRTEEERLIAQAYRMPGVRGLLIKTLFQTGARVSEFVQVQVPDVYFDEQMLLITHAKGGKQRYVPLLP